MREVLKAKFAGIDSWNRPVFSVIKNGRKEFIGSVKSLFSYDAKKKEIIEYFKKNSDELLYFGTHFDCEPYGDKLSYEIEINDGMETDN